MKFKDLLKQNKLFDSHCHLNSREYDQDRAEVVVNSISREVSPIIDIGIDSQSSSKALETSVNHKGEVYAAVGVDPQLCIPGDHMYVSNFQNLLSQFQECEKLARENPDEVIMIGETGLDLYWMKVKDVGEEATMSSLENQKILFEKHIELAKILDLPMTIHTREAVDECIEILSEHNVTGVFHSLTPEIGDDEKSFEAKVRKILEMGYMISLNGITTYKSANLLRNTVLKLVKSANPNEGYAQSPIEFYEAGFIFETDGPWLAPEGKRGQRNEPGNVKDIFEITKNYLLK